MQKTKVKTYQKTRLGKMRTFSAILLLIFCTTLSLSANSSARVTGQCSNCHTMHDSQNGTGMATGELPAGDGPPHPTLLTNSCLGCHSSSTSSTTYSLGGCEVPVVYYITGAPAEYLAGGNFYWVKTDDTKGHNVFSDNPDDDLSQAPGKDAPSCSGSSSCHMNLDRNNSTGPEDGLKRRQGCTKCHMVSDTNRPKGFHHADDSGPVINGFPWYRFLQGHHSGTGHGVSGIEDDDWQKTIAANDHNEYLGHEGDKTDGSYGLSNHTVTGFCCGCHRLFHEQNELADGSGSWLRHPSDAVIPDSGEYSSYTVYDPLVPVSRSSLGTVSDAVTPGTDMVMCLSCHRAHGSPYPDMLRWDYNAMTAGGGGSGGCFVCHTEKN